MTAERRIYCATTNPGKLREFKLGGAAAGWTVEPLPGLASLAAPDETGATFAENAAIKAIAYSLHAPDGAMVLVDDSGLAVDALDGAPGVWSARYAGPEAKDEDNNRLVLERMAGRTDRAARFVCVIALAQAGALLRTFEADVRGELLTAPRGAGGFGYDPLFFYPPFGVTLAEASPEQKLSVSHRGAALRQLFAFLG